MSEDYVLGRALWGQHHSSRKSYTACDDVAAMKVKEALWNSQRSRTGQVTIALEVGICSSQTHHWPPFGQE